MSARQRYYDCKVIQHDVKRKAYRHKEGEKDQQRVKTTEIRTTDCASVIDVNEAAAAEELLRSHDDKTAVSALSVADLRALFREELISWATSAPDKSYGLLAKPDEP